MDEGFKELKSSLESLKVIKEKKKRLESLMTTWHMSSFFKEMLFVYSLKWSIANTRIMTKEINNKAEQLNQSDSFRPSLHDFE